MAQSEVTYYRRRVGKRLIYYARFLEADGSRSVAKSTGKTNRPAAEAFVREYLAKNPRRDRTIFGDFASAQLLWSRARYA